MCGICCILSTSPQSSKSISSQRLFSNLKKRGPDLSGAIENRFLSLPSTFRLPTQQFSSHIDNDKKQLGSGFCDGNSSISGAASGGCAVEHNVEDRTILQLKSCTGDDGNSDFPRTEPEECRTENHLKDRATDRHAVGCLENDKVGPCSVSATRAKKEGSDGLENWTGTPNNQQYPHEIKTSLGSPEGAIHRRGGHEGFYGSFFGQVLHLRGNPTPQPVEDADGNILLWNGEVFDGIELNGQNDTKVLSLLLRGAETPSDVLTVMGAIRGPWSFVYWQATSNRLWFGRDFFGRRSLLWQHDWFDETWTFALSSVAHKPEPGIPVRSEWEEVPACGIFSLNTQSWCSEGSAAITCYPWQQPSLEPSLSSSKMELCGSASKPVHSLIKRSVICGDETSTALGEERSIEPFGDTVKCVVGNYVLSNPISSLNMDIPDEHDPSGVEGKATDMDGAGEADLGGAVLKASLEVQEKAEELIRVLGEAVRKRVTDVPPRAMPMEDIQTHSLHHQNTTGYPEDEGLNSHLKFPTASPVDGDQEASHRKESQRTPSISSGSHKDGTLRGHTKPGRDASTQANVIDRLPGRLDDDLVWFPSSSFDRCLSFTADCDVTHSPGVRGTMPAENVCEQADDVPNHTRSSSLFGSTVCCPHGSGEGKEGSRVGVLFSGGLDSIVLAALADRYVPEEEAIDLFNVAFEQRVPAAQQTKGKDRKKNTSGSQNKSFDVPDRLTGRAGLAELQAINPHRRWNFVEIDVTLEELQILRSEQLCHLIYPQDTVLDDSIGCAIWFAARGRGKLVTHGAHKGGDIQEIYTSPAKVVLVGMGADEQLAGYSRHRSKFKSEGWQGLLAEIKMEVDRISARNLGRDDRVISDHGRESRLPYLDEDVVSFLNSLPIHYKADLKLPRGIGEKLLLRVAAQQLGLTASSKLPKRAIQFGSRIAKLENHKEKASDRCNRLDKPAD